MSLVFSSFPIEFVTSLLRQKWTMGFFYFVLSFQG
jgi:hypothetical protein